MKSFLDKLRLPALITLAAIAPLGAWMGFTIHRAGTKIAVFIGAFDLLIWVALALALLMRVLMAGPRGAIRALWRAPMAAWFLLVLVAWSGLAWPRLTGAEPPPLAALARELFQLAEYGLVTLVVFAELIDNNARARRATLAALGLSCGLIMAVGAIQYFTLAGNPDFHFQVGSLLKNRNAFGALLAIIVPFAATMALGRAECCCWWNLLWGMLAALGTLLALSGGAVLGIVCGVLVGAAAMGRRRLVLAFCALLGLLLLAQALPGRNMSAALGSITPVRTNPRNGDPVIALRYLRYASEIAVIAKGLPGQYHASLIFGLGPGAYDREKAYRPDLDGRFAEAVGQTDVPANYDVLANEPNSFDLWLGQGAQLGLLGLAGFLWLFAWWAASALLTWKRAGIDDPMRAVGAGALAAVVGAAVAGVFTSPWIQGVGPVLVAIVAIALPATSHKSKTVRQVTEVPHV